MAAGAVRVVTTDRTGGVFEDPGFPWRLSEAWPLAKAGLLPGPPVRLSAWLGWRYAVEDRIEWGQL